MTRMILGYLDPGSGSLILQALLGGAAGLGVAARALRRRKKSPDEASATPTDGTQSVDDTPDEPRAPAEQQERR